MGYTYRVYDDLGFDFDYNNTETLDTFLYIYNVCMYAQIVLKMFIA